ncbi:tRNA lysidine(34) synthetase TilS [Fodinicola feengrottensis]|uniref:tRNA(Ile)-lysidine synthase n=1 Tax=Fodinicola feengrottensis TaxID=435914 RepID=A0ABP4UG53_9ACTN|nr:tRNA lysidine(34) synthetase TilS [Fodinicola feengrottensis]
MAGPPPPLNDVRAAVAAALTGLSPGELVLVACSGGPDSLALADALAYCAPQAGLPAGLLTVDHGLQDGSASRAADVRAWALSCGLVPAEVLTVSVDGPGGPEAAARTARYAALDAASDRLGAAAVLLGHTRDDQAETVLLGLARGSGIRAAAGMPARRGRYLRPLLDLPRSTTTAACAAAGLKPWCDPHNSDPAYARSRLRKLLPTLEEAAPGVTAGLARTAKMARADADLLDSLAASVQAVSKDGLLVAVVATEPEPIRRRVLHSWASTITPRPYDLSSRHIASLDALIVSYRGQGAVALPGGVRVRRSGAHLRAD